MMDARQATFEFRKRGGARTGAGRRPKGARAGVRHRERPAFSSRHPVHVTLRLEQGLESLRRADAFRVVRDALVASADGFGARIVHFSVQTNHVHLICEAQDEVSLSRGMKGLGVRIARRLNALWRRSGRVIADRYHSHVLTSPREVWNALRYVLQNAAHHGIHLGAPDPCSSARWFDGWDGSSLERAVDDPSPLSAARSWLLNIAWRRHGSIPIHALVPRSMRARACTT